MDRPALEPGDIVEVATNGEPPEIGVVILVIDYSEDSSPSLWEVWVLTANAGGGMFDPNQLTHLPHASEADLPDPELRDTWREIRRQGDRWMTFPGEADD